MKDKPDSFSYTKHKFLQKKALVEEENVSSHRLFATSCLEVRICVYLEEKG